MWREHQDTIENTEPSQSSAEGSHGRQGDVVVLAKVKDQPYQIPEAKVTTVILRVGSQE